MNAKNSFKPAVSENTLETRVALSGFAPNFVVVGRPVHVFPTGPGIYTPFVATPPHSGPGYGGSGANSGPGSGRGNQFYM